MPVRTAAFLALVSTALLAACGHDSGGSDERTQVLGRAPDAEATPGVLGGADAGKAPSTTLPTAGAGGNAPVVVDTGTPATDGRCYHASELACATELEVTRLMNELRAKEGRAALAYDAHLGFVARSWSAAQAKAGALSHSGFPSEREKVFVAEFPAVALPQIAAENCAATSTRAASTAAALAAVLVDMWTNSSGHRANMLSATQLVGVGVHVEGGQAWATQIFANP